MIRTILLTGAVALAGGTAAIAQANNSDIHGNWTFEAELDQACSFDGTAYIGEALDGGTACELTALQYCPDPSGGEAVSWRVRQTCTIQRKGDQLLIRSEIQEFLDGNFSDTYRPDNWMLEVVNDNLMEGRLVSYASHPARWVRDEGPTS